MVNPPVIPWWLILWLDRYLRTHTTFLPEICMLSSHSRVYDGNSADVCGIFNDRGNSSGHMHNLKNTPVCRPQFIIKPSKWIIATAPFVFMSLYVLSINSCGVNYFIQVHSSISSPSATKKMHHIIKVWYYTLLKFIAKVMGVVKHGNHRINCENYFFEWIYPNAV